MPWVIYERLCTTCGKKVIIPRKDLQKPKDPYHCATHRLERNKDMFVTMYFKRERNDGVKDFVVATGDMKRYESEYEPDPNIVNTAKNFEGEE